MSKYKLSPDAAEDIERLFLFGIDRFGVNQASKYLSGLEIRLEKIAHSPATYPKVSHIRPGYRRSVYGVHTIYFRTIESDENCNQIEISRVIGREHLEDI